MSTLATKPATELKARDGLGRRAAKKIRAGGYTPINLYGGNGPAVSLSMKTDDVHQIIKNKQKVLKLAIPGGGEEYAVFQKIDWDATLDEILHIDLIRAGEDTKLKLEIPLRLDGVPEGLGQGGNFFQEVWKLRIAIVPGAIPDVLVHDISGIGLDQELKASDLELPEGGELVSDAGTVICGVRGAAAQAAHEAAKAAEAAEAAEAAAAAEAYTETHEGDGEAAPAEGEG